MSRIVIKLGGSTLTDAGVRHSLLAQIAELKGQGRDLVLVHGGGNQIAAMLGRLQIESRFHDGLRITDRETRDVVQMVLAGKVGKDLVAELGRSGVSAVSLAGGDGTSFMAERTDSEDGTDLGFVGRIVKADPRVINALSAAGVVPLFACIALGTDWEYYNINGDQMAAAVAIGCGASQLVFVTDVGAVRDRDGRDIPSLNAEAIREVLTSGVASGGMRPKLRACLQALDGGIARISIVGGNAAGSLTRAVAGELVGTEIAGGSGRSNATEQGDW